MLFLVWRVKQVLQFCWIWECPLYIMYREWVLVCFPGTLRNLSVIVLYVLPSTFTKECFPESKMTKLHGRVCLSLYIRSICQTLQRPAEQYIFSSKALLIRLTTRCTCSLSTMLASEPVLMIRCIFVLYNRL